MVRNAKTWQYTNEENAFWERFFSYEGRGFSTMKGLQFSFDVRGNEVFFDRKAKSVTRATIIRGYRRAMELTVNGGRITSPKQLGVFGASYLLPVLGRRSDANGHIISTYRHVKSIWLSFEFSPMNK